MRNTNKRITSEKRERELVSSIASLPAKAIGFAGNVAGTVLNRAVDVLPFEAHIPGYQYCGSGTDLKKRLARSDPGINPLDKTCKAHDIAYSNYSDYRRRAQADKELAERAWQRVTAPDSNYTEKAVAWAVTNAMKMKSKFGGALKRKGTRKRFIKKKGKGVYLEPYRPKTECGLKKRRSFQTNPPTSPSSRRRKELKMLRNLPNRSLSNVELMGFVHKMNIPYFRRGFHAGHFTGENKQIRVEISELGQRRQSWHVLGLL